MVHTEWVRYGHNQAYSGYLARMERAVGPLPAVIVLQEIWGVDPHIEDVTRRIAEAGYVAFAPDLYARQGSRPNALKQEAVDAVKAFMESLPPGTWGKQEEVQKALSAYSEDQQKSISDTQQQLFGGLQLEKYADQLKDTVTYLEQDLEYSKGMPAASMGFCMGGGLSALLGCIDPRLQGAVVYYGSAPSKEQIAQGTCPVIGFYGKLDERITSGVSDFASHMKEAGRTYESHIFEGAHHAFFNDTRGSYNADAARNSFAMTLNFLKETIGT